jgi:hypothetical protein
MLVDEIEKAWKERAKGVFYSTPTFVGDALTLGAGTMIARAGHSEQEPSPGDEARVMALLAAAFDRSLVDRSRAHLHRALRKHAEGDALTASIHVALMSLPRLNPRDDAARRLFAADRLMRGGVTAETIFVALGLDPAPLRNSLNKYSPDQPRVPAGSGRTSGQWTLEGEEWTGRSRDLAETRHGHAFGSERKRGIAATCPSRFCWR